MKKITLRHLSYFTFSSVTGDKLDCVSGNSPFSGNGNGGGGSVIDNSIAGSTS